MSFISAADSIRPMNKRNANYTVKRTTTGLGLFTEKPISRDKRIIEYVGPIITNEEVDRRGGKYMFELDKERAVDGSSRSNIARYINHSCRPNAKGYTTGNRIWIWSLKAIPAGAQITINYGKQYFDEHIKPIGCKCDVCVNGQKKRKKR